MRHQKTDFDEAAFDTWMDEINALTTEQMATVVDDLEGMYPFRSWFMDGYDAQQVFDIIYANWVVGQQD